MDRVLCDMDNMKRSSSVDCYIHAIQKVRQAPQERTALCTASMSIAHDALGLARSVAGP
jgi:hypothetical protein